MAIWVELRCERRGEGRASWQNPCWSDDNNGPGELADDTQQGIRYVYQLLTEEAKKAGWKLIRGEGWVCPNCQENSHV